MGVILPGVERDGIFPSFFMGLGREEIIFCGSGTGEVWEFTPMSPSSVCVGGGGIFVHTHTG